MGAALRSAELPPCSIARRLNGFVTQKHKMLKPTKGIQSEYEEQPVNGTVPNREW
jgi:hypothetical protein